MEGLAQHSVVTFFKAHTLLWTDSLLFLLSRDHFSGWIRKKLVNPDSPVDRVTFTYVIEPSRKEGLSAQFFNLTNQPPELQRARSDFYGLWPLFRNQSP